jgi:hypothetical protein
MTMALDDVPITEPARSVLRRFFEESSAYVVSQERVHATAGEWSEPSRDHMSQEIARRRDRQRRLDDVVAAVRSGEAERAIALADSSALRGCDIAGDASLLAQVLGSGHSKLLEYVRTKMASNPVLVRVRYADRTLLHDASAQAPLSMVELHLSLGADPKIKEGRGPLYSLAYGCRVAGGGSVVLALVQAGANVDAPNGVKFCTALHMAGRRRNVRVAEAQLDCGADIESLESLGDSLLRRSVNCHKVEVATLLLSRGADVHSRGSKGLTPIAVARTSDMKRLFQSCRRPKEPKRRE